MSKFRWTLAAALLFLALVPLVFRLGQKAAAQEPERQTTIVVSYTEYEWWLIRWQDNEIQCRILVDHEGLPEVEEVILYCGADLADQWQATPPCPALTDSANATTQCDGLYLHQVASEQKDREVVVQLPPPVVYVSLEGCDPQPPENLCAELPALELTAEEPLPNEFITAIQGTYGGEPFVCEAATCLLPLRPTPREGVRVEFWADSSYGDSSERYTAQVRVIDTGVSEAPGRGGYYVDVISAQWRGAEIESCARIWQAFPSIGAPPTWLSTPSDRLLMASDKPYYYLAGRLIAQQMVDAGECPNGGLLPNGYANACGLETARSLVDLWQDQLDQRIISVADETGVPAQLMKNLFAQESQFWPGIFRVPYEFGLGQLTDTGADSILLWNASFFDQFCPLVLAEDACQGGYLHLDEEHRAILRGALALQANADCADCPAGIDLTNTDFSVALFAGMLQANCEQVGQIVYNASGEIAGDVATYEDLWRMTIANYHGGPGCLSFAAHSAWERTGLLTWDEISIRFTDPCRGVVPYVEKITDLIAYLTPMPTVPGLTTTPTPTLSPTATPTVTPEPGVTPTPTETPEAYPPPSAPTNTPEGYIGPATPVGYPTPQ